MNKPEAFDIGSFDPNKNYVLEASAGTGKTFSIIRIVEKLLLDESLNLSLSDILIVTYTDKAAGELKSRIRGKIQEDRSREDLSPAVREKIQKENPDTAPIYTIHSFCQQTLRKYGVSAGLPLNRTMLDENFLSGFASRYVREGAFLEKVNALLDLGVSVDFDRIESTLVKAFSSYYLDSQGKEDPSIVLLEREEGRNFTDILNFLTALSKVKDVSDLKTLSPFFKGALDPFLQFYQDCQDETDPVFSEKAHFFVDAVDTNIKTLVQEYSTYRRIEVLSGLLKFDGGKFRSFRNTKAKKTPENDEKNNLYRENAKQALAIRGLFEKTVKDVAGKAGLYLVPEELPLFYEACQKEKEKAGTMDFTDLLRDVRENVLKEGSLLKQKLREEFRYAVIDEFQDTNRMQFDIFASVFLCGGHHLIVVGDPKQSIYSFQGADIQVYYQAKETILKNGGELRCLNKNYRSRSELVDACNRLFANASFYDFGQTTFEPSSSLKQGEDDAYFEAYYDGKVTKPLWVSSEADPAEYAKKAVRAIVDCCTLADGKTRLRVEIKKAGKETLVRNVTFKDFAVLAQKRSELVPIKNELRKAGIPFLQYKDTDLFFGKECADWIAVIDAVNTPDFTGRNRDLFRKALFTEFFGCTLKDLASPDAERDDLKEVRLFNRWRELAEDGRYEDLVDDILVSTDLSARLSSLNEMQSFGKYKQIGDYAISYLSAGHSLDELVTKLRNLSAGRNGSDDEGDTAVRKSTDFDAVQLLTMHASKGLDFPIVISVGQKKDKQAVNVQVLTYHALEKDGTNLTRLAVDPRDEAKNRYVQEQNREVNRLYYVAYTRPRFLLFLDEVNDAKKGDGRVLPQGFVSDNPDCVQKIDEIVLDLPLSGVKKRVGEILSAGRNGNSGEKEDALLEQNEKIKGLIRTDRSRRSYKHSYSSLSHSEEEKGVPSEGFTDKEGDEKEGLRRFDKEGIQIDGKLCPEKKPLEYPPDYPKGTNIGTTLHEIFELSDFTDEDPERRKKLVLRCFREQGYGEIPDSWADVSSKMVREVLHASFPEIRGNGATGKEFSLNELTMEDKKAEIEFNFNLLDEKLKNYCNGFIDLLFRRGDYYSIIDWKSDRTKEDFPSYSDKKSLKDHVDDAYSIQRTLYSYCLIEWLKGFYPELSEEEIFEQHFGGIYYVFIRGCVSDTGNGVYAHTWKSWSDLKKAFDQIVLEKVGGRNK